MGLSGLFKLSKSINYSLFYSQKYEQEKTLIMLLGVDLKEAAK